jgi:Tfp pilus assembly protein PilO
VSRRAPLIAGIVAGVLSLLLVVFLVLPKLGDVSQSRDALHDAESKEQQLRLQLQQLEAAKAAAPQTTEEIRRLDALVPPTVDQVGMFLLLSGAANRAGVDPFTMSPRPPAPSTAGSFSTIPVAVTVTGTYFACEEFLYNVETLPRAAKVLSLSLTPGGGGDTSGTSTSTTATSGATSPTGELNMQLSMEFYTTDTNAGPGSAPGPSEGESGSVIGTSTPPPTTGA